MSEQATIPAPGAVAPTLRLPAPLQCLDDDALARAGLRLWLKRDDLIHPDLAGNKWRKLKHTTRRQRAR